MPLCRFSFVKRGEFGTARLQESEMVQPNGKHSAKNAALDPTASGDSDSALFTSPPR